MVEEIGVMGGRNKKGMDKGEGLQQDTMILWGDDIYSYYLDCGDGFTVVYKCHIFCNNTP